ncbi:unnamed protein product [Rotaria magnacalcarata]|uniref:Uncharacterized protein n=2 Tax=Rotaria magnacalcarata TaxID=392030 RepID=A0A816S3R0_9BILA|nr:unnamed protein product [Rotaria magnacalcarata]CAF2080509.1 unnamed protein product [Rotaria magnacalcarata]
MKRLTSILKKEKTNPPTISRRTQLKPGEVWQNQTPTSLHEQRKHTTFTFLLHREADNKLILQSKMCRSLAPSSTSNDLRAPLDEIVDEKYQKYQQLKILEKEEQRIVDEKKKIQDKKKKIEEYKKKVEEYKKKIQEEEMMVQEDEKNVILAKKKLEDEKKRSLKMKKSEAD